MASFYKKPNGTYLIRAYVGRANGKDKQVSCIFHPQPGTSEKQTLRDVVAFAKKFQADIDAGRIPLNIRSDERMTLEGYINEYYFDEAQLTENTSKLHRFVCDNILIPSFGKVKLTDINANHLRELIHGLSSSGSRCNKNNDAPLASCTIKRYCRVFKSTMRVAAAAGHLDMNPFDGAHFLFPHDDAKETAIYDEEQSRRFLECLQEEPLEIRVSLSIAIMLGLRRGEIAALMWDDFHFNGGFVHVARSAYKLKGQPQGVKAPKTKRSIRDLVLPQMLVDVMLQLKEEQNRQKADNPQWIEKGFVFTRKNGDMKSLYSYSRICSQFEARHGLPHVKLHGLRHTCASLLVGKGVDLETTRSILGHASLRTTEGYTHAISGNLVNAAATINAVFEKKEDSL